LLLPLVLYYNGVEPLSTVSLLEHRSKYDGA
jgi:hypothetical protein